MEIRKIIVGVDFSEQSEAACREALRIARHTGAEVVMVHAINAIGAQMGRTLSVAGKELATLAQAQTAAAREQLEQLRERLDGQGADISHMVVDAPPADALAEAADRLGAELVITGTIGRSGIKRFLLGSVAERTVRLSQCSVMVARKGDTGASYERILVPTDFSAHGKAALAQAVGIAGSDATIDVVHFWQPLVVPTSYDGVHLADENIAAVRDAYISTAEEQGQALIAPYLGDGRKVSFDVLRGAPADGIVERAQAGDYDLVVLGSHGYRGFRRFILGSVAERVARHAACSVLVTHLQKTD